MLFNSLTFVIFLPLVFAGYWLLCCPRGGEKVSHQRLFLQNLFVVITSYIFYGWWDWRFLLLIAFTTLWAFASGVVLAKVPFQSRQAKWVVALALIVNLGILGVFKYYNFFQEQAVAFLQMLGFQAHPTSLQILLPVGISFYTFQALSYVLDVYRGTLKPTRNIVAFFAFVSFFPQLVAGPIERATNLLPQFQKPRVFDYAQAVDGCRQMLWGFFKKMVVADMCAVIANDFLNTPDVNGLAVWLGVLCFTFQIYGDFSGYSDIAIGCGKLFGINLMQNFAFPYFSRDIAEFWRRWHISLTTWFRDYLYIPLGGSRGSKWQKVRNVFIIFLVSGFWHGANWTFILWGAFHAACFMPLLLLGQNRKYLGEVAEGKILPSLRELGQMLGTFLLAYFGWLIFRAPDIQTVWTWLVSMFSFHKFDFLLKMGDFDKSMTAVAIMLVIEWINRTKLYGCARYPKWRWVRWVVYFVLLYATIVYAGDNQEFIYFQF